jgi:hypothetical protein
MTMTENRTTNDCNADNRTDVCTRSDGHVWLEFVDGRTFRVILRVCKHCKRIEKPSPVKV